MASSGAKKWHKRIWSGDHCAVCSCRLAVRVSQTRQMSSSMACKCGTEMATLSSSQRHLPPQPVDPEVRAVPTPAATNAVYRQLEQWLPMTDRETDNVFALTTRTYSAQHLQGFFQQSGGSANAETAVKVAGATAKHCAVLHGKSTFLRGTSRGNDYDHECYTRANVAYSRATDLTRPINVQGTTGMSQVLSALLHGVCTVCTNDQQTSKAFIQGEFHKMEVGLRIHG